VPADGVGGDYYDFLPLGSGRLGIALGDVSGKGMYAGLLAAAVQARLQAITARGAESPAAVMTELNRLTAGTIEGNRFATVFFGAFDAGSSTLTYANAGHPTPLLLVPRGRGRQAKPLDDPQQSSGAGEPGGYELQRLDAHHSPMIGVLPAGGGTPGRGAASVRCPPGSVLLLYTDGLTDVAGDDADARTALLERTVAAVPPGSDAATVVENVLAACLPEPLRDDVALLAVRLTV